MKLTPIGLLIATTLLVPRVFGAQFVADPARAIEPTPTLSELLAHPDVAPRSTTLLHRSTAPWIGSPRLTGVGSGLAEGPDLDGDCMPEMLVAACGYERKPQLGTDGRPSQSPWPVLQRGVVWAVDPRSARALRCWQGRTAFDRFGTRMCSLDDLDDDGIGEIAITSPGAHGGSGCVEIFRGSDGTRMLEYLGQERGADWGEAMVVLPDLDRDGIRDLAIGAPHARGCEERAGSVTLLSTATGAVLASIPGPQTDGAFGSSLDAAHDLTGDGVCDLVIGAPWYSPSAEMHGAGLVLILSLPDTSVAGMILGAWSSQRLGVAVGTLPSFEGAPRTHLVVASAASSKDDPSRGMLQFFAAPDFSMVKKRRAPPGWPGDSKFGAGLAVLDDLDGDGGSEVAVGAPGYESGAESSAVFVFFSPGGQFRDHWHESWWEGNEMGLTHFGTAIVRLTDLDDDGVGDYAIGAACPYFGPGGVTIVSGKRRAYLREVSGNHLPVP